MRLDDLRGERVAVYPPGVVPMGRIIAGDSGKQLRERFGSAPAATKDEEVQFGLGRAEIDGREVIVTAIRFDDRRIIVGVEGSSDDADAIAAEVDSVVFGADRPEPTVVSYVTASTATLSIEWTRIFNAGLVALLDDSLLPGAATGSAKPRVVAAQASFALKYRTPADLDDRAVTLSPKSFAIGAAPGVPLEERKFISQSPLRSEDHLKLLEELEKALG